MGKAILRAVVALVYLVSVTAAQASFLINSYWVAEDPTYDVSYVGNLAWSTGSTITGSLDIGVVHSKKEIFLICSIAGTSRTLTAASTTVASVAVTKSTTEASTANGARSAAFVSLPTQGGTQSITVTYSGTLTAGFCDVYKVRNRPNRGNNETSGAGNTCVSVATCAVSTTVISNNGIWFGAHTHTNANATTTPSGTTAGSDTTSGSTKYQTCFRSVQVSGSTPTDTWSWTTNANAASTSWAYN